MLAVLLVLLVFSVGDVSAEPSETEERDNGGLMAEERARFVEGASDVARLDDEQIARVLEGGPELISKIPVEVRTTSETVEASASEVSGDSAMMRAAASGRCASKLFIIEYLDSKGDPLFQFLARKKWCIDGKKVLSGRMDAGSWIREDARYTPEKGGWYYAWRAESGTEGFRNYGGRYHAGHKSTRAGKHEFVFPGDQRPAAVTETGVIQTGHYNGACVSRQYVPLASTKITSGPRGSVGSRTARFGFSSTDRSATFGCNLDGGGFKSCASPKVYTSLRAGSHTFQVEVVDSEGNAGLNSSVRTWTVDVVAPRVTNVAPAEGAKNVAAGTNIGVVFSESIDELSLFGNFTVRESRTGNPVDGFISYDSRGRKAVLNSFDRLAAGATYTVTVRGGPSGVTDIAGTPLTRNKVWSFTVAR